MNREPETCRRSAMSLSSTGESRSRSRGAENVGGGTFRTMRLRWKVVRRTTRALRRLYITQPSARRTTTTATLPAMAPIMAGCRCGEVGTLLVSLSKDELGVWSVPA